MSEQLSDKQLKMRAGLFALYLEVAPRVAQGLSNLVMDVVEEMERENEKTTELLRNLLARVHRDGGDYVGRHGIDKATVDAEAKVVALMGEKEELAAALRLIAALQQTPYQYDYKADLWTAIKAAKAALAKAGGAK